VIAATTRPQPPRIVEIRKWDGDSDDLMFDVTLTLEATSPETAKARLNFLVTIAAQLGCEMSFIAGTDFDQAILEGEPA